MSDHPGDRRPERSTDEAEDAGSSQRAERVRAARTARHRRWADLQVEEAMRRGDFDDLPSAGRPLDLGDRHDPNWWIKRLIKREQIEGTTPPAIALRLEDERLDDQLDGEISEREVRRRVAEFNRRVRDARRQLLGGPPVITPLREEDLEVQRWRERRERRAAVAAAERAAAEARAAQEQAERRLTRRLRRTRLLRSVKPSRGSASEKGATTTAVGTVAVLGLTAVAGVAGGAWLLTGPDAADEPPPVAAPPSPTDPPSTPSTPSTPSPQPVVEQPEACSTARGGFRPVAVSVPGVQRRIEVVYPARDARGVPGTPPLTTEGKAQMAYDVANGIPPGADRGNALFNAHTWPDGSALGNRLLDGLEKGSRLRVRGRDGQVLCYRLARRVEVPATVSGRQYYRRDGRPRMAIVVCSGDRDASGNWSHRTLFFAAPVD